MGWNTFRSRGVVRALRVRDLNVLHAPESRCNVSTMPEEPWKICSTCKRPIAFRAGYYACSVSTCNRKRTGLFFCSVPCWDAHVPEARHRDAWAEPRTAPTLEQWRAEREEEEHEVSVEETPAPRRRIVGVGTEDELPREVLVVVSKLKAYVKARSGMNTSDNVVGVLSDHLRKLCNEAIRNAAREGRKTVMERDFTALF
jgi:histone H3/H4